MDEELKLIKACVKADKASQEEFVQRYSRLIYNYIHNTLKIKGADLSKDTIQDIFQGIFFHLVEDNYCRLKKFKGRNGCKFSSWLRTIIINYTTDYLRRLKPTVSLDEEDEKGASLMEILTDIGCAQDEALIKKERLEHLADCIETLDSKDKYFIELHINKGLPLEDLVHILKLKRGAIDMRKRRIIAQLKECFRRKGHFIP
ncbi:MAG: sigma-70 family RNA polymerase sigma factor [Candidatus Omnitrophica bacterium]|nr:sigma-70 family RNA polymerase sigma factor [Candidatus Omnitrophota bacterium]